MSLYVLSTPIGNLKDITLRALEVLKEVDYILSEAPLITLRLLKHYSISKPLKKIPEDPRSSSFQKVIKDLKEGKNVALVARAGTPLVSDPGRDLVRYSWQEGIKVVPIVGASSVTAILSVCPLRAHRFVFLGFLPKKGKQRREFLEFMESSPFAVVFYESPHRLEKTLEELKTLFPERKVFIGAEMTKLHERFYLLQLSQWDKAKKSVRIKGEFTIVLEGAKERDAR